MPSQGWLAHPNTFQTLRARVDSGEEGGDGGESGERLLADCPGWLEHLLFWGALDLKKSPVLGAVPPPGRIFVNDARACQKK